MLVFLPANEPEKGNAVGIDVEELRLFGLSAACSDYPHYPLWPPHQLMKK
jgi:hypothetical protein